MVDVGASALYLLVCFLFSCLSIACFLVGFKFGQQAVVCLPESSDSKEDESGYVDYKPSEKFKAYIPGKEKEDVD